MTKRRMSSAITGRPWTPAEDEAIRESYRSGGARDLAPRFGRTLTAVYGRARRIGVHARARWTRADDRRLRNLWPEYSLTEVSRRLDRTALAVFQHAKEIGLALGCPDGFEYLSHSAVRTGYSTATLRNILERSGIQIRRTMSRPLKGSKKRRRPCHFVEPFEVDEAIKAWLLTESLEAAAKRYGLRGDTLARRLSAVEGLPPKPTGKRHWRIPSDIIDRAMGAAA